MTSGGLMEDNDEITNIPDLIRKFLPGCKDMMITEINEEGEVVDVIIDKEESNREDGMVGNCRGVG
uniref:Uncharacterized protein n=1 Tax=viral metagenome TaxID=1070528 RepID=A0A6M3LLB6_9ZZZZ